MKEKSETEENENLEQKKRFLAIDYLLVAGVFAGVIAGATFSRERSTSYPRTRRGRNLRWRHWTRRLFTYDRWDGVNLKSSSLRTSLK